MELQKDDGSSRIYAASSSINEQGKHSYNPPGISVIYAPDQQHLQAVIIYVDGPPGWVRAAPVTEFEFPISSLDWHNKIMAGLIRLCCGQEVLDGLMVQIDKYVATYGDYWMGPDPEFTEGGFTFGYYSCRLFPTPTFQLAIEGK